MKIVIIALLILCVALVLVNGYYEVKLQRKEEELAKLEKENSLMIGQNRKMATKLETCTKNYNEILKRQYFRVK